MAVLYTYRFIPFPLFQTSLSGTFLLWILESAKVILLYFGYTSIL